MSNPVVKGLVGIAMMVVGAMTGQVWLTQMGVSMILAGASQALMKSPTPPGMERDGVEINVTGEDAPIFRCYGEVKVGGHLSILGTSGDRNQYLRYAVTHSVANACGVEDITDVWVGDRKIDDTEIDGSGDATDDVYADFVNVQRYLGTDSETADADLVAALSYVDSHARGDYMAKTVWTFLRQIDTEADDEAFAEAFPNGPPQIQALVRGQKVYDPRKDSTNGGSGTHRLADPDTWEWSRNPILCGIDYTLAEALLGGIHIDADDIDWAYAATQASICDESITVPNGFGGSTTQARYLCDIALDTGEDTKPNLDKIMASCMGAVTYGLDGKLKFHAGAYEAPATTVDNDWLAGDVSCQYMTDIHSKFNAVRSSFIDPGAEYHVVQSEPFTSSTFEAEDGGKQLWKEVQWAAVYNRYSAQYLNHILGMMSRNQRIVIADLNMRALDIEAWEVVTLDFPDLDVSGTYRVTALEYNDSGARATFEELASDTYDIELADFTEINPVSRPGEKRETPPAPTGLSATATVDGIALSWTNPGLSEFSEIHVQRSDDGSTGWTTIKHTRSDRYTDPITDGATKYYRLRARSATGSSQYSDYTSTVNATAKAALMGGRGVNVMHPRYSHFSELSAPPIAVSGTTATLNTSTSTIAYGSASLQVARVAGGSGYAFLSPASSTYNLLLRPKKYIVSAYMRRSAGDASDFGCEIRIRKNDGTYYTPINVTINTTRTRYSGVVDLSANSIEDSYNVSIWNTGGGGSDAFVSAIMIEELAGNQTDPSDYVPPVSAHGITSIAADEGQVADQRSMTGLIGGNRTPAILSTDATLSSSYLGVGNARITVASHTRKYAEGTVSITGANIDGNATGVVRHVYYDDRYFEGGSVSFVATGNIQDIAASKHRFYVGSITTATSGGGTSGGYPECLTLDMILDGGVPVCEVPIGHALEAMTDDGEFVARDLLWKGKTRIRPCVEIATASASIVCTETTPVNCDRPGGPLPAAALLGQRVMTKINGVKGWQEVVEVRDAGRQPIVRLSWGGVSFAAGRDENALIYTHNGDIKP